MQRSLLRTIAVVINYAQAIYPLVLLGVILYIAIKLRNIEKKISQHPENKNWIEWK